MLYLFCKEDMKKYKKFLLLEKRDLLMKATIEETILHIKNGELTVVLDDNNHESEGDLIHLGTKMIPENVNFMITQAYGLWCVPVSREILD